MLLNLIAAVHTNSDKDERNFDTVLANLLQHIHKKGLTCSFHMEAFGQEKLQKHQKTVAKSINALGIIKEIIKYQMYTPQRICLYDA